MSDNIEFNVSQGDDLLCTLDRWGIQFAMSTRGGADMLSEIVAAAIESMDEDQLNALSQFIKDHHG